MKSLKTAVAAVSFVLAAMLPAASALADVRSVTIDDGLDQQSSSPRFTPTAPKLELLSAQTAYDSDAGSVRVSVTFKRVVSALQPSLATTRAAR